MFHRSDDRIIKATVIASDITERKQAEEELRTALQRLHALFAGMQSSLLLVGQGRIEMANQAFCDYFGLQESPGDLVGLTPRQLIDKINDAYLHPDEQVKRIWEIARGGQSVIGEEISMQDGRTSLRDFIPIYADGKSYGLLWHHIDITERKRAEEALQRLNQELEQRVNERTAELQTASLYSRSLIEASLDPLVTISPEGKVTDVNEATEHVTGRSRSELIGTDFSGYFTEPDAALAGYRRVLAEGQVRDYPLTIRDASGNKTDVLYNATVYRNAQGYVQGVFAAARDVTETKRIEAELARYRDHLEDLVKERTAELEAANKELESFSYSVSHDLRAPLRAIDGYARMLLKKHGDEFDEDSLRKFNVIRSSSQMMGQLIDDILTLSRVVKKHLSASQIEMDAVVREVWKDLETIEPERNMKLTVRDLPAAFGDRTLIKQVYANLLSNAVKFTKYRDPALIETGGYVEGNENVYYIKDNGVGFEMEYYDKLFGIFQRLHKPDEFEGTGVGLATVERIIQRHGGRAWAEGKVNEGATFYFTLPRRR
jgi:PAS domain S-box-containing protein